MLITAELIAAAEAADACKPMLDWLRQQPRTLIDLVEQHSDWALWAAGRVPEAAALLSPEQIDRCAEEPSAALEFAARRLSPERRRWCEERQ